MILAESWVVAYNEERTQLHRVSLWQPFLVPFFFVRMHIRVQVHEHVCIPVCVGWRQRKSPPLSVRITHLLESLSLAWNLLSSLDLQTSRPRNPSSFFLLPA